MLGHPPGRSASVDHPAGRPASVDHPAGRSASVDHPAGRPASVDGNPVAAHLEALTERYPTIDAALARIAALSASLTLPKGTVHVVSDVHGEFKKLTHILANASGSLRSLVDRIFGARLDDDARTQLLSLIYYPSQTFTFVAQGFDSAARAAFVGAAVRREVELLRALVRSRATADVARVLVPPFGGVLGELVHAPETGRDEAFVDALLAPFVGAGRDVELLRATAHAIRNLSVAEVVVAGDLGDRGPRIDKVIELLMRQPNVAFTWGNHDASWIGACLGSEALIATVLRISLRYRRLSQLEEGYGIPVAPLEKLARTAYGDDAAERFACKGEGLRDAQTMARMQKAAAVLQFKLEGQIARRRPHFDVASRSLLERIDAERGTVDVDGVVHPLLDAHLPTVDPKDPIALTADERACVDRIRRSFLESRVLWDHVRFVVRRGAMSLVRDDAVIFHGCVPVDARGEPLALRVAGAEHRGKALFDALEATVRRAVRARDEEDLDMLWYLWSGPRSPLFGKDKMATFEAYFVADKAAQKETKNPYFTLIHDASFCDAILGAFGVDPARGLIVNGHVPVHVEKGESPVKKSGKAVTIDGAFSEAYGDRGYTLVLAPERTYLAEHHHFESIEDAITRGADIVPKVQDLAVFDGPRRVGDTEEGDAIRAEIAVLERLVAAYRDDVLQERA